MKVLTGITEIADMLDKAIQGKENRKQMRSRATLFCLTKNPRKRVSMDFKTSSLKSQGSKNNLTCRKF